MRISALNERRRLNDLDAGDVINAEAVERGDLVAGAGGDAEDLGVVAEEMEVAEEEGERVDFGCPEARGAEAKGFLIGRDVGARGEVARGFGETEVGFAWRIVRDTRVGGAEEEEEEC